MIKPIYCSLSLPLRACLFLCMLSFLPVFKGQSSLQAQTNPCTLSAHFEVPANGNVSLSSWFPAQPGTSAKIFDIGANATLTVDKSFIFTGCTFRCGQNAKIVVSGTSLMSALSSRFYTCSSVMWNGIEVQSGANVNLYLSRIFDAYKAIYFPPGYNSAKNSLRHNVFDNNQYGLYLGNSLTGGAVVGFTSCWANVFQQSGSLKDAGIPWAHSGAYLVRNSVLTFGSAGGAKNTFQNMKYGIFVSANSNALIANSDFLSMNNTIDQHDGTGVYASNSTITVYQASGTGRCLFDDNVHGVLIRSASGPCTVEDADFEPGFQGFGIKYDSPANFTYLRFESNNFTVPRNARAAIYADRPPQGFEAPASKINYNQVDVPEGSINTTCQLEPLIKVQGNSGAENVFEIIGNTVENASECRDAHGIYVSGAGDQYQVQGNTVAYMAPANRLATVDVEHNALGIVFTDMPGDNNEISDDNQVTSRLEEASGSLDLNNNSFIKCGIHVVNCNAPTICDNFTNGTYRGIHFGDANPGTIFGKNSLNIHVFGLECRNSGSGSPLTNIDDQIRRENTWSTIAGDYIDGGLGAKYADGSSVPFDIRFDPAYTDHKPPTAVPSVGSWFISDPGQPQACGGEKIRITDSDIQIAKDEYSSPNGAATWDLQRRLWYKLIRHPELADDDPDVAAFYANTAGSSPEKFARAFHDYEQAYFATNTLAAHYGDYDELVEEIRRIDLAINQDTTLDKGYLFGALDTALAAFAAWNDELAVRTASYVYKRDLLLNSVQTSVNSLPATTAYEQAWKTILTAGIQKGLGNEPDSVDRVDLLFLANSCPADVGSAWQEVLAFMPGEDARPFWGRESEEDCVALERSLASQQSAAFRVFPNPAVNYLRLYTGELQRDGVVCTIWSLSGQPLASANVAAGQTEAVFDVSGLSPGIYFLQWFDRPGALQCVRFAVVK